MGRQILQQYCAILSRCVRGLSRKRCKIITIADHSSKKRVSSKLWQLFSSVLSRDKGLRQPPLTSTSTNLSSSSSIRLKECVLSPAMCGRPRMQLPQITLMDRPHYTLAKLVPRFPLSALSTNVTEFLYVHSYIVTPAYDIFSVPH